MNRGPCVFALAIACIASCATSRQPTTPQEPAVAATVAAPAPLAPPAAPTTGLQNPAPEATASSATAAPPPAAPPGPMVELPAYELEAADALAAADTRYAEVSALVHSRSWARARAALDKLLTAESTTTRRFDLYIGAQALLATVASLERNSQAARRVNTAILDGWSDPAKAVQRIEAESATIPEQDKLRRMAFALNGVGQATYARGEEQRAVVSGLAFPAYQGARTTQGIERFLSEKVKPWVEKKQRAIESAESAYGKVTQIQPAPPPRWVIASAERVGTMWYDFVADFTRSPRPKEWDAHPELLEAYRNALGSASEPLLARAQAAYRLCVALSDKYRIETEHSRICRARLLPSP